MPSNRKRIGFLPSEEVHDIIEKICIQNKYSQSKVTGILVEEALRSRGVLKNILITNSPEGDNQINDSYNKKNDVKKDFNEKFKFNTLNSDSLQEDLKMIKEFIEFKFFKKVMRQNNNFD